MNGDQKNWIYYAIPIVVLIGLAGALYYGKRHGEDETAPPSVAETPVEPVQAPASEHHPIETPPADEPLPPLDDSDAPVLQALQESFGDALIRHLVPKDIVRRFVTTIDNLPRKKTPAQMLPVKPTDGELATRGTEEIILSEANFKRYDAIVNVATRADTERLVALYQRLYPLFQQAYEDLGYPEGYFNDRLIEVIDHLLETPEIREPIKLVQPGVFYEYADPSLESRSSGQKLLLRMGPDHAAAVKLKLRDLRKEIARRPQTGSEPKQP